MEMKMTLIETHSIASWRWKIVVNFLHDIFTVEFFGHREMISELRQLRKHSIKVGVGKYRTMEVDKIELYGSNNPHVKCFES